MNIEKLMGMPPLASESGRGVDDLMIWIHVVMVALFVGWLAYFAYVLFRFRQARHPKADYRGVRTHASNYIEGAVALVEGVLLIGLALPIWAAAVEKFPKLEDSVVVKVSGQQFAWNVLYPNTEGKFPTQKLEWVRSDNPFGVDDMEMKTNGCFTTLNEIHVVKDKPVILQITSKDVIHSFKVLPLRLTQDAIPGMSIPIHFVPTQTGVFQVMCAQLCGNGHSAMTGGRLYVDTPEQYAEWIKSKAGSGGGGGYE